jgi:hypothetical protein
MREFRRQRELEETFGHDSDFVETNYRFFPVPVWVGIAFMLYHLPCLVLMFLIPRKTRTRHRLLVHVLLMVLTVSTYTALVAWACSVWATPPLTPTGSPSIARGVSPW